MALRRRGVTESYSRFLCICGVSQGELTVPLLVNVTGDFTRERRCTIAPASACWGKVMFSVMCVCSRGALSHNVMGPVPALPPPSQCIKG